jgi:TPR repeat protein
MYDTGEGVAQNLSEAAHWHQKATEQGQEQARNAPGYLYQHGEGVEIDKKKAAYPKIIWQPIST